ncbi:response regulator [Zhihengliuella halotolerans]|uniref:response regulator n=1 Tax=Zhihengliuella halotolerans TaxID=370736 RepID=UPI000C80803F|nr:response regulator transcription factor [Zhihengliuella halotolerans]
MSGAAIRVLIADDHASVRAGLRLLLGMAGDIEVVGEAADGEVAVAQERALRPDVVLMDARMPGVDGVEATRRIVTAGGADVLMLTTFDLDEIVFGGLKAGAAGFLLKTVEPQDLFDAIRRVAAGDGVVAPEVTRQVLRQFAAAATPEPEPEPAAGDVGLTPRETDVLRGLGRGRSNAQIAGDLTISLATVKTHVSSVLAKTGTSTRMQAAIHARRVGLV